MKQLVFGVIIMATLSIIGVSVFNKNGDSASQTGQSSSSSRSSAQTYSAADVAMHDNENDCWTIINQNVYDITSYIPRHAGGDEILLACGVEGTSLFENRTSSNGDKIGSGTPHSQNAESQLASLQIGSISE